MLYLVHYYLRRRRLCFHFGLFVCLSVCLSVRRITEKVDRERIFTKFLGSVGMAQGPMSSILVTIRITVRIQESTFHFHIHWIIGKSYQRILMKFYGELGRGLETN